MKLQLIAVAFATLLGNCLSAPVDDTEAQSNEAVAPKAEAQQVNPSERRFRQTSPQQQNMQALRAALSGLNMEGMNGQMMQQQKMQQNPAAGRYAPAPSAYPAGLGGLSYPSAAPVVPCAKNLLVSCQPHVVPVPCGGGGSSYYHQAAAPAAHGPAPASSYYPAAPAAQAPASAGAYSEHVLRWAPAPARQYYQPQYVPYEQEERY